MSTIDIRGQIALESKGHISPPSPDAKNKAKHQALRLVSVNGAAPSLHIGAVTYFRNDVLRFFWRDPKPEQMKVRNPIKIIVKEDIWGYYYQPALDLLLYRKLQDDGMLQTPRMVPIKELDIEIGAYPFVLKYALDGKWEEVRRACADHKELLLNAGYQPDGLRVIAGESWLKTFVEPEGVLVG